MGAPSDEATAENAHPDEGTQLSSFSSTLNRLFMAALFSFVVMVGILPARGSPWSMLRRSFGASYTPDELDAGRTAPRRQRVALVFSGQPRFIHGIAAFAWRECLLDRADVDIYAHFWWQGAGGGEYESINGGSGHVDGDAMTAFFDEYGRNVVQLPEALSGTSPSHAQFAAAIKHLRNDLNVNTSILTEKPIPGQKFVHRNYPNSWKYDSDGNRAIGNVFSQYASMQRAAYLWSNFSESLGIEYDWVVRARTDVVMKHCPDIDKLEKGYIYMPDWHGASPIVANHAIYMPANLTVAVMGKAFDRIDALYDDGVYATDERIMYAHIDSAGLLDRLRFLPTNYFEPALTRDGGGTQWSLDPETNDYAVVKPLNRTTGQYEFHQWMVSYKADGNYRVPGWQNTGGSVRSRRLDSALKRGAVEAMEGSRPNGIDRVSDEEDGY